jgi:hypothetical protein
MVNIPGLGLSQHLSVLQTGGTEKGTGIFLCRTTQAQPVRTLYAQPA